MKGNKKILGLIFILGIVVVLAVFKYYFANRPLQVRAADHISNEEATDPKYENRDVDIEDQKKEEKDTGAIEEKEADQEPASAAEEREIKAENQNSSGPKEGGSNLENPPIEFRAAWISTVYNLDWPSRKDLSPMEQKQEFITLLDGLEKAGFNAVIVQIKPTADSFYPSKYGPWSEYLTGVQGQDPGYNPLTFMIEETHKRNMEFHAWFNPYRVSVKDNMEALTADHPARKNPAWVVAYGGKLYYNPGIPEVRQFVIDSILEVVKNYDIDGVHLDDYFYPYPEKGLDFPDEDLYQAYKRAANETKEDWRRNNINDFVENLYKAIKKEKSHVVFGISPFGIWRNRADDPRGSETRGGVTSYDSLYADSKYWVEKGWVDYIAPQLYWYFGYDRADYGHLVDWWSDIVKDRRTNLYIGHAAYKVEAVNSPWGNPQEIINQIRYNRKNPQVKGSIFFRAKSILNNPLGLTDQLANEVYQEKSKTPSLN